MPYAMPSQHPAPASSQGMVDLRSDTVTRPSAGMLEAMMAAPTGDDVWGDDPTVRALEERTAALAGKAAGLFFPSGTQSNLAALMAHCARGDEFIVGQRAHTYRYEGGGAAVLAWGNFINAIIKFVIVSFAVFWVVKLLSKLKLKELGKAAAAPAGPSPTETLLAEIRDELRAQRRS